MSKCPIHSNPEFCCAGTCDEYQRRRGDNSNSDSRTVSALKEVAEEALTPSPIDLIKPACNLIGEVASGTAEAVGGIVSGIAEVAGSILD
jgi:hypothetical protein